jgi:hypothetical protein
VTDRNRYTLHRPQPDEPTTYREMAEEHEQTFAKTLGNHVATEVPAGAPNIPHQPDNSPWGGFADNGPGEPFGIDLSRAEDVSVVDQTHYDAPPQTDQRPTVLRVTRADLLAVAGNSNFTPEESINLVFGLLSGLAHLNKELRTLDGIKAATKKAQAELDAIRAKLAAVASFNESLQQ